MRWNMGQTDRIVRALIVAPLLLLAAWAVGFGSVLGILAIVFAAVMVVTSVIGSCPLYSLLGIQTRRIRTRE